MIDFICMFMHACMGGTCMPWHICEGQRTTCGNPFFLPPCGPQGLTSNCQGCQQLTFPLGTLLGFCCITFPLPCDLVFYSRLILKMLTVHQTNVNLSTVGLKALDLLLDSGESSYKCSLLSAVRVKV